MSETKQTFDTPEDRIPHYEAINNLGLLALSIRMWAKGKGFEDHVEGLRESVKRDRSIGKTERDALLANLENLFTGQQVSLIVSEIGGEFVEATRKPEPDDKLPQWPGELVEWADSIVRHLHLGSRLADKYGGEVGYDVLNHVLRDVLCNNEGRPHKHGGKSF